MDQETIFSHVSFFVFVTASHYTPPFPEHIPRFPSILRRICACGGPMSACSTSGIAWRLWLVNLNDLNKGQWPRHLDCFH